MPTAAVFRRYVHKQAHAAAGGMPQANPFVEHSPPAWDETLLREIRATYPATTGWLDRYGVNADDALDECPVDQAVVRFAERGGRAAGLRELERFLDQRLDGYLDPPPRCRQRLWPQPLSALGSHWRPGNHQAVWDRCGGLDLEKLPEKGGSREGFWPFPESPGLF